MNKIEMYKALLAVVTEYAEGRGPLIKYKSMNDKIIEMTKNDSTLFRYLGFNKEK